LKVLHYSRWLLPCWVTIKKRKRPGAVGAGPVF
jgi:hypothetical protein